MIYISLILKIFLTYSLLIDITYSQSILNPTPLKKILNESGNKNYAWINDSSKLKIIYNQFFYNNSNLTNFENQNGLHIPRGFGFTSGLLFIYEAKNIFLTYEPRINVKEVFYKDTPQKNGIFSVSNDLDNIRKNDHYPRNFGFKYKLGNLNIGYGNWDQWWGPGIHNSITLSNNSKGFYNYHIDYYSKYLVSSDYININLNYNLSEPFKNSFGNEFFLTSLKSQFIYKNIEVGVAKDILSGGYSDIKWRINDAALSILLDKNSKYWNKTSSYYIKYFSKETGLNIFYELGVPKIGFNNKKIRNYSDHGFGTNFGLRKYKAFGHENFTFGFEYTRLLQSPYYNILPSPNWYDDKKYNYSSYMNRRWGAHSGPDSDDLLVYIGSIDNNLSLIYALNYERRGVTYNFPPEVKFESKIMFSFRTNKLFISIDIENEYFEHYGFVDTNLNVWNQTFQSGSIQRTNSVLFSIESKLF